MSDERLEYIRELAVRQLESLQSLGGDDLKGTSLEVDLVMAISSLKQEIPQLKSFDAEPANINVALEVDKVEEDFLNPENEEDLVPETPQGFEDEETYQAFIATQADLLPVQVDEETGEVSTVRPDDVVGNIGGHEVGDMEDSLAKVDEYLIEQNTIRDEETDEVLYINEPDEVPSVKISLTREDENELTVAQVLNNVLAARESTTMLDNFGDNFNVLNGETVNQKIIQFFIDNNDEKSRKVSQGLVHARNMMQFGGRVVIPGIGLVSAETIYE